ncbi:hypothetical protein JHK82_055594 [Glycine max]|nr:hypothetical protein JHK82_055594 [Glycine max]
MALISKNNIGFLIGVVHTPPPTDTLYAARERCNTLISMIYFDLAIDIWNDLKERFSQGDLLHIAELQEEIYGLKSYHQQDLVIRFLKGLDERFFVVHSQVLLMDPLPTVNKVFSMVLQHESNIPRIPLPWKNKIVSLMLWTNASLPLLTKITTKTMRVRRETPRVGKSIKVCTYYGRTRHTINECYAKHGYTMASTLSWTSLVS